jgi:hypothetical protein
MSKRRTGWVTLAETVWRIARRIFHESTGAIFLIFGLFWSVAAVHQWFRDGTATIALVMLALFALLFLVFGVTSFRAARRVR